jgi:hypothetical protein
MKLHIGIIKRMLKMKEGQIVLACDGGVYFKVTKEGDYIILEER